MKTKDKNYEEDLLASFDQGEWQSVHDLKDEIARYATVATASFNKDKRINIRLSSRDLENIQIRAAAEGMPYQTLIASVLHKYVNGRFIESTMLPVKRSAWRTKIRRSA